MLPDTATRAVEAAGPGEVTARRATGPLAPVALRADPTAGLELVDPGPGPYLVLSPHLDDAALSCAALVGRLAQRAPVLVVTVFSEAGPEPHTLSARAYLRQCGGLDAAALYAARREEDALALRALGADWSHLGYADALFRSRLGGPAPWLRWLPPALRTSYPTYRWHIARGEITRRDRTTVASVGRGIREVLERWSPGTVLAPLGIGRHVDHRLLAAVAEQHVPGVVWYADLPYALTDAPDPDLVRRQSLVPVTWTDGADAKPALLAHYRTQVGALFPGGVPALPECYFVPRSRLREVG